MVCWFVGLNRKRSGVKANPLSIPLLLVLEYDDVLYTVAAAVFLLNFIRANNCTFFYKNALQDLRRSIFLRKHSFAVPIQNLLADLFLLQHFNIKCITVSSFKG